MIAITEKEKCCGCSACMNICPVNAIEMLPDAQGFLYPFVNTEKCIDCGKCESVCPILSYTPECEFEQEAYIIQHKDPEILRDSTSGGAFTAIAKVILDRGGAVFGAGYGDNFHVIHRYTEDFEGLHIFRNSKYVQSDKKRIFTDVKKFLNDGKHVLFSGTPCEVEGLLNFLGDLGYSPLLLTVDIVCRAVPSPLVLSTYLNMLDAESIKDLRFRDKGKYGYLYSQLAVIRNKKSRSLYEGIETNIYLRAFFSNVCDRPSCYSCKFKKRYRRSDITLWDCWEVSKFSKKSGMFNQNAGITRALVHSKKGSEIMTEALNYCINDKISADDAVRYDSNELTHSVVKDEVRYGKFWAAFNNDAEGTLKSFFPRGLKVRLEAALRRIAFSTGIYSFVRRSYRKLFGQKKR